MEQPAVPVAAAAVAAAVPVVRAAGKKTAENILRFFG